MAACASEADGYRNDASGFDCSVDGAVDIVLPSKAIIEGLCLCMPVINGQWLDDQDRVVAFDPSVVDVGPSSLVIDRDSFLSWHERGGYRAIWVIRGEKETWGGGECKWSGRCLYRFTCWYENGVLVSTKSIRFDLPNARLHN